MTKHRAKRHGWNAGEDDRAFGHALRIQRKHRRLTLAYVAGRLAEAGAPMSEATLARIESGDRPASTEEGRALLAVYGVAPGVLPGTARWEGAATPAARPLPLPIDPAPAPAPAPAGNGPQNGAHGPELARIADALEELVQLVRARYEPPADTLRAV